LVVAKRLPTTEIGDVGSDQVASVVTSKDLLQFNRNNVGDALNLLSGVTLSTNSRNEKTVAVRGFDSRQFLCLLTVFLFMFHTMAMSTSIVSALLTSRQFK
jgi:hypothetical protein